MLKERLQRLGLDKRLRDLYKQYERILIPGFLVVGFIFDVITFRTLQIKTNLILLMGYVLLAAGSFSYTHIYDAKPQLSPYRIFSYLRFLAPLTEQISFSVYMTRPP